MLTLIKLLHTLIGAVLAGSILALPLVAMLRRFPWAGLLTALVVLEISVLALNGGRCPLTDLAAKLTTNRADNFDIYLPIWLARFNKVIFGRLFVAGELIVLASWLKEAYFTSPGRANNALH